MKMASFSALREEIKAKLDDTFSALRELCYDLNACTAREFYDYMTGETFTGDKITIKDVLDNPYLMIHEVVEISQLKKMGANITTRVIVDSSKEKIYSAHLYAMEYELNYIQSKKDAQWLTKRLQDHYMVLTSDPWIPDSMKPVAQRIWDRFKHSVE
jgi:hypothetical protein